MNEKQYEKVVKLHSHAKSDARESLDDRQARVKERCNELMSPIPVSAIAVVIRPDGEIHSMAVGVEPEHVIRIFEALQSLKLDMLQFVCSMI